MQLFDISLAYFVVSVNAVWGFARRDVENAEHIFVLSMADNNFSRQDLKDVHTRVGELKALSVVGIATYV